MIGGVLGMGRRMAEARMTETATVGRFERKRVPGTLDAQLVLVETYYQGPVRVKFPSAAASVQSPTGQQMAETNVVVSLPSGARAVPTGALVQVHTSGADEALPGRFFRIDGPAQAGQTTAHRYPVVEES